MVRASGVVGPFLGLPELQRFLQKRQGKIELSEGLIPDATLFMLAIVLGVVGLPVWPSETLRVSSRSGMASSSLPTSR